MARHADIAFINLALLLTLTVGRNMLSCSVQHAQHPAICPQRYRHMLCFTTLNRMSVAIRPRGQLRALATTNKQSPSLRKTLNEWLTGTFSPAVYRLVTCTGLAPWEISRPQPVVVNLVKQGAFDHAEVLDMGCSIGDNAIYIAKHAKGAQVTAYDFVSSIQGIWVWGQPVCGDTQCYDKQSTDSMPTLCQQHAIDLVGRC
jgi:hypothetical protein